MGSIFQALGELLAPIGTLFHYLFYLPVFNILMGVYMLVHSFALAIVVLTLLIRVALIPLTRAQLKSQQEMQKLAPELNRLKQQYRGDQPGLMQAQQALYREHGVSPAKGCLPLLIQMPFLYALYNSFYAVLRPNLSLTNLPAQCKALVGEAARTCLINNDLYPFMPHLNVHMLPDTHFLWANLAAPDPLHIFPILAAVLTFLQLRMAMPVKKPQVRGAQVDSTAQATATATNTMQYMMPAITLFIGLSFPAGLAMYWCISTLFSAVQQYFLNGNFGSLFVGVPGMQHLVPPPKDLTVITTPTPLARTSARRGALPAPSAPPPAPEGGLRGMWKQLREVMAAPPAATVAQSEPTQNGAASGTARETPRTPRPASGASGGTAARDRRPRPAREGPTLVRPAASARPEEEIAREAASTRNGKAVLPEEAIARDSAASSDAISGTGKGMSNGTGSRNGTGTRPGGAPRSNTPPNTQPRANNPQNYRKGSPPGRRGGRPKGGR